MFKNKIEIIKVVFTEALKLLNDILARNKNVDIIWLCRITLELTKLLETQN